MKIQTISGVAALLLSLSAGQAWAGDADAILKSMSDYLASQKALSARFESSVEVLTTSLEKLQFNSSGEIAIERPGKLHLVRTGGYVKIEVVSDGTRVSVYAPDMNVYAQGDAPADMDELIGVLHDMDLVLSGSDLLLSDVHAALSADVLEAKHIGIGVIEGAECEHLAFRNAEFDWQLWVRTGDRPIPCKYVINSKNVTGSPQYSLTIHDWRETAGSDFTFDPPADARLVEAGALPHLDEIPQGESK
jgi:hypothetical protein